MRENRRNRTKYQDNGLLGRVIADSYTPVSAGSFIYHTCKVDPIYQGIEFETGQVIVILDPITGRKNAGPMKVLTYDRFTETLVTSQAIEVLGNIYISGAQNEVDPPVV
jgi:hypothetical protein